MLRNESVVTPNIHAKRDLILDEGTSQALNYIIDEISSLSGVEENFTVRKKPSVTIFSGRYFQRLKQEKIVDADTLKETLNVLYLPESAPQPLTVALRSARLYRNRHRVHVAFQLHAPELTSEYRAVRSTARTLDYNAPVRETRDFHLSIGGFSVAGLEKYIPEDPEDLGPAIYANDIANAYRKKLGKITLGPFCFADQNDYLI